MRRRARSCARALRAPSRRRCVAQRCAALRAVLGGIGHDAARGAAACPRRCAAARRRRSIAFGTLKRGEPRARTCSRSSSASAAAPARSTTSAVTASPHSGSGAAEDAGLGDGGVLEQHGLDLGRRDVLAAGDDRVGLAADARSAGRGRRARPRSPVRSARRAPAHGRPGDEDLAVGRDRDARPRAAAARRSRGRRARRS